MPPPRIQFAPPPANFQNLAILEEALEKMHWCFHIWPLLLAKLLRVIIYPNVLISIFHVFLLHTYRIYMCVCSVLTVQVVYTYHTSICKFISFHVANIYSKRINRVFEYTVYPR